MESIRDSVSLIERTRFAELLLLTFEATLAGQHFGALAEEDSPVTTEARIKPIITTLTTISA